MSTIDCLCQRRGHVHHVRRARRAAANRRSFACSPRGCERAGRDVFETAEPGGTPIGQQIRRVLLDAQNREMCPTAELLLMFACRAQNVDQWILPALAAGKIVLSDRFTDSTLVYQGIARGLGTEVVYEVDRIACRGLIPDLTLVIDIDTETGLARAHHRAIAKPRTSKRGSTNRKSAFTGKSAAPIINWLPTSRIA